MSKEVPIEDLVGKTFSEVITDKRYLLFILPDGGSYAFCHLQKCCEKVRLHDVNGDLKDLAGTPLLKAECTSSRGRINNDEFNPDASFTWTFYNFATIKGYVNLRWYGESNGYYSEKVDLIKLTAKKTKERKDMILKNLELPQE